MPVPGPPGPTRFAVATDLADAILPFLVSGGYTFWPSPNIAITRAGVPVDYFDYVRGDGAQLVTAVNIPWGKVGFLKEIRVAPLKPSVLADVWNTVGVSVPTGDTNHPEQGYFQSHRDYETYTGIWDVPMGWESYDTHSPGAELGGFIPNPWLAQLGWQWQLTVIDGTVPQYRTSNNIPPFDPLIAESWYLAESMPVPASVYAGGFPGRPIGVPQRMQVLPGDSLHTHAVVPGNSTICLWARWYQARTDDGVFIPAHPLMYSSTRGGQYDYAEVAIIGPSVGSLHGYTQPDVSAGSNQNAVTGWGG